MKIIAAAIGVFLVGRFLLMALSSGLRNSLVRCDSCRMFVARSDWQTHQRVHIRTIQNG